MTGNWFDSKCLIVGCALVALAGCASSDGDDDSAADNAEDSAGSTSGGQGSDTTQGVEDDDTGSSTAQAETTADDTTGVVEGPCGCFVADPDEGIFDVTCELPDSCGNVNAPDEEGGESGSGGEIDETGNLEVLACFFAALAAEQETQIGLVTGDPSGQYSYFENLVVLEGGATLNWEDNTVDLSQVYTPVMHRADAIDVSACPDAGDSLAQWACIEAVLEAARVSEQCTEEVVVDIGV